MKIIKPNVEIIDIVTPGKKIEFAARTCYLSNDKITDDSHIKFIENLVKSKHLSTLEHERVIIKIDLKSGGNPFLTISQKNHMKFFSISNTDNGIIYISGNIRAWYDATIDEEIEYDNGIYKILKNIYPYIFTRELKTELNGNKVNQCAELVQIKDLPDEIKKYHDSKTFNVVCSRSCTHQIVRHRSLSFSQQSQRYVNFANNKFGHSINFIIPDFDDRKEFDDTKKEKLRNALELNYKSAEANYFSLINDGLLAEDARAILPNATATNIVITGTTSDWESFIALRSDKHAQKEIRDIALSIKNYLKL